MSFLAQLQSAPKLRRAPFAFVRRPDGSTCVVRDVHGNTDEAMPVNELLAAVARVRQGDADGAARLLTAYGVRKLALEGLDDAEAVQLCFVDDGELRIAMCELSRRGAAPAFVVDRAPDLGVGALLGGTLLFGSQDVAVSNELLRTHGVRRVLNVGALPLEGDANVDAELGIERRWRPLLDVAEQSLERTMLVECDTFASGPGATLVHCNAGVSRRFVVFMLG